MGSLIKLLDFTLFFFFLLVALTAPFIDGQSVLPLDLYPRALVDLKKWYTDEFDDYLIAEKPHFLVGLVWLELFFQWPLSWISLYGIATAKPWLHTSCLMFGVANFTSLVAILAELTGSNRASDKLLKMYFPFLGFSVLAILRGLVTSSGKSAGIGKRPALNRKKRA